MSTTSVPRGCLPFGRRVTVGTARPLAPTVGPAPLAAVPRIPDQDEFARLWSQVPTGDRRRILRAVNRGRLLDRRKEAALAVVLARRQQRFWRYAWLLGPLIAVPLAAVMGMDDAGQIVAYALLGAAVLLAMSVYYTRRARRAEQVNADHAIHGRRKR